MTDEQCIICPALHPATEPAWAEIGQVCAPDYGLITSWLRAIPEQWEQLNEPEALVADQRIRYYRDRNGDLIRVGGEPVPVAMGVRADPVASAVVAGPVRGQSKAPRVSGGDSRPLGVPVTRLDLMVPVSRVPYLRRGPQGGDWWTPLVRTWRTDEQVEVLPPDGAEGPARRVEVPVWHRELARDPSGQVLYVAAGDQQGVMPVARWLDQTVQAWLAAGAAGRLLPEPPEVPVLVDWLLARLDWAVARWVGWADWVLDLRRVRGALRVQLGDVEDREEQVLGVRCGRCASMGALVRSAEVVRCSECGAQYYDETYDRLLEAQALSVRTASP